MVRSVDVALVFFFFNDTATTEIYTLSLHDALPIFRRDERAGAHGARDRGLEPRHRRGLPRRGRRPAAGRRRAALPRHVRRARSEEHTSELQSRQYLVCRLLLEKKKNNVDYTSLLLP